MSEHVFISYSRTDADEIAKKLHDHLEANGFATWLDTRDIKVGENWDLAVDKAIRECWALLFVMTPNSVESPNCHDEWSRALSFKKPVIPLLIKPCEAPLRLHRLQYIDFTGDFTKALARLCDHLRWMQSTEGEVQVLEDRLRDLNHELDRSDRQEAVLAEINGLQEQIAYKRRAINNPNEVRAEYRKAVEESIDAERQFLAKVREQDRSMTRRRVIGSAPQGVSDLFKDRSVEITAILNNLLEKDVDVRAVSIYGMGGIGKTALACRVMQELEKDQTNVYGLVYLSTRTAGISLERIYVDSARMLGGASEQSLNDAWGDDQTDIANKIQILLNYYDEHRCIILLDNLEDLLDSSGNIADGDLRQFVDTFLRQKHDARLLITSREPLNAADDARRYEKLIPLEQGLPTDYAIELLKAFDRDGHLGLVDAAPNLLRKAVEKTHGYPRALEAIAGILAQDPFMSLDVLLEDSDLFDERVTEKLIQEAQSRLDNDTRRVMQALAVYGRPVREAAVRFLLEPYAVGLDIGETLRRLARGRYITVKRSTGELAQHPLDKDYSYKQIPTEATNDYRLKTLEHRAADYYMHLRTPSETWKSIHDLEPQLAEFEHRIRAGDYDQAAGLVDELSRNYLLVWGHARRVMNMRERLLGKLTDRGLEERNLGQLGMAYHSIGQVQQAITFYQQALIIARELDDRRGEATRLGHLGIAYAHLGEDDHAIEYYQHALAISREIGDQSGEAKHLGNLGLTYRNQAQLEQAIGCYEQALLINRQTNNRQGEAKQLGNLGLAYCDVGRISTAVEYYQQALTIAQAINDRAVEEFLLGDLSEAYHKLGNTTQAMEVAKRAVEIAREIDDRRGESYWVANLGKTASALLQYDQAIIYLKESIEIASEINEPRIKNLASTDLASVYLYAGRLNDALKAITYARQIPISENDHASAVLHGIILARLNEVDLAQTALQEAISYANELLLKTPRFYSAKYTRALALSSLALLNGSTGETTLLKQAQEAFRDAMANCAATGIINDVLRLLSELRPLGSDELFSSLEGLVENERNAKC
jgi:tetratricopeptide (TPR) repeat protein